MANVKQFQCDTQMFYFNCPSLPCFFKNKAFLRCFYKCEPLRIFCFFTAFLWFFMITKLVYLLQKTAGFFLSIFLRRLNQIYFALSSSYTYNCILQALICQSYKQIFQIVYEVYFSNVNKPLTILKCSDELNFEFNVNVDSCINSSFVVDFYNLVQFTGLNIFKALTPEDTR